MQSNDKKLTLEEVAEQMMRNKLDVHQKIEAIHQQLSDGEIRMDEIEAILSKHESQRQQNNQELKDELRVIRGALDSYRNDFNNHDRVEMDKYDKIIEAINNLTEQLRKTAEDTDANTVIIHDRLKQEEIDRAIAEALDKDHAPYKEYKKQAVLAVIGIVSTGVIVGLYKLTVFISDIDNLVKGTG